MKKSMTWLIIIVGLALAIGLLLFVLRTAADPQIVTRSVRILPYRTVTPAEALKGNLPLQVRIRGELITLPPDVYPDGIMTACDSTPNCEAPALRLIDRDTEPEGIFVTVRTGQIFTEDPAGLEGKLDEFQWLVDELGDE